MKFKQGAIRFCQYSFALPAMLLCSVLIFQSCKKDRVHNEPSGERKLFISFTGEAIAFTEVDSANIVMKKQGSGTGHFRRFDKGSGRLELEMDDNLTGNWTADITIYTKRSGDGTSRMYTRQVGFTLPLNKSLNLAGPEEGIGGIWKAHVVLASAANQVVVVIAEDNGEPYFDIRVKDSKWDYFYVERAANRSSAGMNERLAAAEWECSTGCYTHDKLIVNTTAFANFSNVAKTKDWNNGEISVVLFDGDTGEDESFFYLYNRK